ncbi:hypothetical protein BC832DRAFT_552979 [Gaertneriomyces semiglobifer]|nr:hypothetical protein BC832DRAFT_552979 [Gaertneriomyces semiglobifer]
MRPSVISKYRNEQRNLAQGSNTATLRHADRNVIHGRCCEQPTFESIPPLKPRVRMKSSPAKLTNTGTSPTKWMF